MEHRAFTKQMPRLLFSDDVLSSDLEPIREFVETAGQDEVLTLFQNPTINGEVLAKLYERASPFNAISEERWQYLVYWERRGQHWGRDHDERRDRRERTGTAIVTAEGATEIVVNRFPLS
jgi:hypothetical protein